MSSTVLSTLLVCFRLNNLFYSDQILHFYRQQGKGQALDQEINVNGGRIALDFFIELLLLQNQVLGL